MRFYKKPIGILFVISCLLAAQGEAQLEDHFRKIDTPIHRSPIKNIDCIYLINLDQRVERLEHTLQQLLPYGIVPNRFSAIYGWHLPIEVINDIGLKFGPGMQDNQWALQYHEGKFRYDFLTPSSYGKTYFACHMSLGGIGCTLSHLSILQNAYDAYDAGYQTIWIIEDDIRVNANPFFIGDLVEKLDYLVGKEGWDILYTDDKPQIPQNRPYWFGRPDMQSNQVTTVLTNNMISEDFSKIGSRFGTHSMIIHRSGMKKILDFEKEHGLFIPYDLELSLIPNIQMYSLRYPLITTSAANSDITVQSF